MKDTFVYVIAFGCKPTFTGPVEELERHSVIGLFDMIHLMIFGLAGITFGVGVVAIIRREKVAGLAAVIAGLVLFAFNGLLAVGG